MAPLHLPLPDVEPNLSTMYHASRLRLGNMKYIRDDRKISTSTRIERKPKLVPLQTQLSISPDSAFSEENNDVVSVGEYSMVVKIVYLHINIKTLFFYILWPAPYLFFFKC